MSFLADLIVDVREMRKVEDMLESPDRSVIAFKDSHLNAVGSVSVAVRPYRFAAVKQVLTAQLHCRQPSFPSCLPPLSRCPV